MASNTSATATTLPILGMLSPVSPSGYPLPSHRSWWDRTPAAIGSKSCDNDTRISPPTAGWRRISTHSAVVNRPFLESSAAGTPSLPRSWSHAAQYKGLRSTSRNFSCAPSRPRELADANGVLGCASVVLAQSPVEGVEQMGVSSEGGLDPCTTLAGCHHWGIGIAAPGTKAPLGRPNRRLDSQKASSSRCQAASFATGPRLLDPRSSPHVMSLPTELIAAPYGAAIRSRAQVRQASWSSGDEGWASHSTSQSCESIAAHQGLPPNCLTWPQPEDPRLVGSPESFDAVLNRGNPAAGDLVEPYPNPVGPRCLGPMGAAARDADRATSAGSVIRSAWPTTNTLHPE